MAILSCINSLTITLDDVKKLYLTLDYTDGLIYMFVAIILSFHLESTV